MIDYLPCCLKAIILAGVFMVEERSFSKKEAFAGG
jgi:hypothetical protein